MIRRSLVLVAACTQATPPPTPTAAPITNATPAIPAGPPCGLATLAELHPFGPPDCKPNGTCMPGRPLLKVGSCTVAPSGAFDLYAGRDRSTVFEGTRPILSSSAPPFPRIVVFDARVPAPHGIRVGMTRADLERLFPGAQIECERDDVGWRGHLLCRVRRNSECDAEDANWHLVVFDVHGHIAAIDLGPDCGED